METELSSLRIRRQIRIKTIENGYLVSIEDMGSYASEEFAFPTAEETLKFLSENLSKING